MFIFSADKNSETFPKEDFDESSEEDLESISEERRKFDFYNYDDNFARTIMYRISAAAYSTRPFECLQALGFKKVRRRLISNVTLPMFCVVENFFRACDNFLLGAKAENVPGTLLHYQSTEQSL